MCCRVYPGALGVHYGVLWVHVGVLWVYSTSFTDRDRFFDSRELRTLLSRGCSLSCLFIQLNNLMHLIVTHVTWTLSHQFLVKYRGSTLAERRLVHLSVQNVISTRWNSEILVSSFRS